MSKKIEFIPRLDIKNHWHTLEKPKPARFFIPEWYKKTPFYIGGDKTLNSKTGLTFKGCVPFLDAMSAGYIISTWFEIKVVQIDGNPLFSWSLSYDPIRLRQEIDMPNPGGYDKTMFAFELPFGFKVPKGYSLLTVPPLNRNDNPFLVPSGIIDDNIIYAGILPFWIKEGFEGIIPIGTPICQVIPFKREDWVSEVNESLSEEGEKLRDTANLYISGFYKKYIHKKKSFE